MQAKELLIKDKSTVVRFMQNDEADEMSKLMNSVKLLNEEEEIRVKKVTSKDPIHDSSLDLNEMLTSFLNLSLKTKLDPLVPI